MKKLVPAVLAVALLLTAVPSSLASPTGASPSEAALWQAKAPAPGGDRQKLTTLVGADETERIFSQRAIQAGPVINNAPVPNLLPAEPEPDDSVPLFHFPVSNLSGGYLREPLLWGSYAGLTTTDFIIETQSGDTRYYLYNGGSIDFGGDEAVRQQILDNCTLLPDEIPVYRESAYINGILSTGDIFSCDDNGYLLAIQQPDGGENYLGNLYLFDITVLPQ